MASSAKKKEKTGHRRSSLSSNSGDKKPSSVSSAHMSSSGHKPSASGGAQLPRHQSTASAAVPSSLPRKPSARVSASASKPAAPFAALQSDAKRAGSSASPVPSSAAPTTIQAGFPATSPASGARSAPAPAGAPTTANAAPGSQNAMVADGYGWMGPTGYDSIGADGAGTMEYNGLGSMGPGGYIMGDGRHNYLGGYGSMGPGGYGSMNGSVSGNYGSIGGGENGMTSIYGMGGPMGSMYGMGSNLMGSMYGMGGNPMGSMYGMGGNPMGSMYGMGGNPMGSMYGLSCYNMGLGSNGASMYGIGPFNSRMSFRSTGGYVGGAFGSLWRAPSAYTSRPKQDISIPPPSSSLHEEMREEKDDTAGTSKDSGAKATARGEATLGAEKSKTHAVEGTGADKKDADAKDAEKSRDRAMPTAMASSHRLTKQVNDNVHVIAVLAKESMLSHPDKSVTVGTNTYQMDEVAVSPVNIDKSDLLRDIVEQTHCGHNVSILALCGSQPYTACTEPITAVVKRMMESFAEDKAQVTQVKASAVSFAEAGNMIDLLEANAKPAKAEIGSNPIYGPCVMNASEKDIMSAAEAAEVVIGTAAKAAKECLVVIMYKIKQIRPVTTSGAAPAKDVYVSSMLVAMVNDAGMQNLKAAEKHATTEPALIFTNAIGGASRTVAIVHVPEKDAEKLVGGAAAHSQGLREIKNSPTRSGNVKRFIDYTERAAAANTKASPETTAKIDRMLKDAKELLARPEQTPLMAYNLFGSNSSTSPPETVPQSGEAAAKKADAPAEPAAEKPAETVAVASDATPTAKPESETQVRLVVCVDGTATILAERVRADEVVVRTHPDEVPESDTLKTLRAVFGKGRNVALLSAETQPRIPLKNQYTWKSVAEILTKAFESPPVQAKDTCIELFMSVVRKRQVLCDLMANGAASAGPKPLGTASSPLFGPVLVDTTYKTLRQALDVKPALDQALQAAPAHLTEPDSMIVMTAVLKQLKTNDDVVVASFMAASGPSAAGVCGAMSKNPDYSRSLLSYAIGGPCVTSLLVCVGNDHESNEAAKSSLTDMHALTKQPNHASRDGSVMAFIDYAKKGLEANRLKLERAQGEERDRLTAVLKRLQIMHDDYDNLLKCRGESMPAYYMGDKRVSPTPGMSGGKPEDATDATASAHEKPQKDVGVKTSAPIRVSAVIMDDDDDASGAANKTPMEVTDKELIINEQRYTPTEVVQVKGGSIRSAMIDEMHKIVLDGYNAAMLTSDVGGSTVGISMAVKTITVIMRGLPKDSEAFWSVTVSKDNKVKDLLADNSPYYDLHLASSPLFGNVPYGANIVPVAEAQVEPIVREVRNEVREKGGVGYIAVILRILQSDGDVCVPSFLVAIAGESVEEYEKVLSTRSSASLLGTAIGGPCNSIYVAGIRGKSGEMAQPVLELAAKMMRVHNGPLRSCSLNRFITQTELAVAAMQRKIEASGGAPNPQLLSQVGRIGTMLKDAQNMLKSPGGSAPAVYKR
ncbi:hypothetical_protein_-_conserved [Leishmania infantum]|nr:hypothetical_protein_-_conserved [Leishmania infantum]SUZ45323.1 hypothetical_protein_-_conserved [Leishmania infantum]